MASSVGVESAAVIASLAASTQASEAVDPRSPQSGHFTYSVSGSSLVYRRPPRREPGEPHGGVRRGGLEDEGPPGAIREIPAHFRRRLTPLEDTALIVGRQVIASLVTLVCRDAASLEATEEF